MEELLRRARLEFWLLAMDAAVAIRNCGQRMGDCALARAVAVEGWGQGVDAGDEEPF